MGGWPLDRRALVRELFRPLRRLDTTSALLQSQRNLTDTSHCISFAPPRPIFAPVHLRIFQHPELLRSAVERMLRTPPPCAEQEMVAEQSTAIEALFSLAAVQIPRPQGSFSAASDNALLIRRSFAITQNPRLCHPPPRGICRVVQFKVA